MEENQHAELLANIDKTLKAYEKDLPRAYGGSELDRVDQVLSEFRSIARNAIYQSKNFVEDVRIMFQGLSLIIEGLTDEGMNHGQKRVIANHCITMIRKNVDRLAKMEFEFSSNIFERFDFFRSRTPERKLYEQLHHEKEQRKYLESVLLKIDQDVVTKAKQDTDLPF